MSLIIEEQNTKSNGLKVEAEKLVERLDQLKKLFDEHLSKTDIEVDKLLSQTDNFNDKTVPLLTNHYDIILKALGNLSIILITGFFTTLGLDPQKVLNLTLIKICLLILIFIAIGLIALIFYFRNKLVFKTIDETRKSTLLKIKKIEEKELKKYEYISQEGNKITQEFEVISKQLKF